jgi:hypothetical protein
MTATHKFPMPIVSFDLTTSGAGGPTHSIGDKAWHHAGHDSASSDRGVAGDVRLTAAARAVGLAIYPA